MPSSLQVGSSVRFAQALALRYSLSIWTCFGVWLMVTTPPLSGLRRTYDRSLRQTILQIEDTGPGIAATEILSRFFGQSPRGKALGSTVDRKAALSIA